MTRRLLRRIVVGTFETTFDVVCIGVGLSIALGCVALLAALGDDEADQYDYRVQPTWH